MTREKLMIDLLVHTDFAKEFLDEQSWSQLVDIWNHHKAECCICQRQER